MPFIDLYPPIESNRQIHESYYVTDYNRKGNILLGINERGKKFYWDISNYSRIEVREDNAGE